MAAHELHGIRCPRLQHVDRVSLVPVRHGRARHGHSLRHESVDGPHTNTDRRRDLCSARCRRIYMEKGGIARERAGVSQEVHTPRCSLCLSLSGLTGALAHGAGREIQAAVSRGRGVSSHAPRSVVRMRVRWRRQARRCRHECR